MLICDEGEARAPFLSLATVEMFWLILIDLLQCGFASVWAD